MPFVLSRRDWCQYKAFKVEFKILERRGEMCYEECFGVAILRTMDPAFEKALEKDPDLIEKWLRAKEEE